MGVKLLNVYFILSSFSKQGAGEQFRREQKAEKEECKAVHKEDRVERFQVSSYE